MRGLFRGIPSRLASMLLTAAIWLACFTAALAQEPTEKANKASGGAAYVAPYALAILCVGVGVALVCNPSRRRDRAKPEDYQKKM